MKKFLILGAGGHGKVAAEVAKAVGYDEIAFLDDNSGVAIGRISDMAKFFGQYTEAFVGIGNNNVRHELIQKLIACGYNVPALIHPSTFVSKSAKIGQGTVIEPMAIVNANSTIGEGCIISVGSIVDHDCVIGECCHINAGAIVMSGCNVENFVKIDAGIVKRNDIPKADSNCTFAKEYAEQNKTEVSFF